ncbi:hypothetical protein CRYUN_Cryun09bG0215900 [Craigia yunnanensis]
MRSRGSSPLVPSLMVEVLGLVIFGPTLLSILEFVLPLFQAGDPDSSSFYVALVLVLLLLLVLVQLLSTFFPTLRMFSSPSLHQTSSSAFDDGFGLGTLLLVVLFLVLYNFCDEKIEVARLRTVCWLDVNGKFKILDLPPGTVHEIVYAVFCTGENGETRETSMLLSLRIWEPLEKWTCNQGCHFKTDKLNHFFKGKRRKERKYLFSSA